MIIAVLEGLILSFVLLLVCVVNIKDGPVGGVHYYEEPVKNALLRWGLSQKGKSKETEDLMPYIHKKTWIKKIVLTIILYPLLAAIIDHE